MIGGDPDVARTIAQAQHDIRVGNLSAALEILLQSLNQTYVTDQDYILALRHLVDVFGRLGDARRAITCAWYLDDDRLAESLMPRVTAEDRARTYIAQALRWPSGNSRRAELFAHAAREFESVGCLAQAAVNLERAGLFRDAHPLWLRLCHTIALHDEDDIYAAGLAYFNLARTAKRDGNQKEAQAATVTSVHLLEEAADRFEQLGQRERAFDCYQVLVAIGRETETIEHVLEGYVNLTRILREDHLRTYALKEYQAAIQFLRERSEIAAAATLCREMADYARRQGLLPLANRAIIDQAGMWRELATTVVQRGQGPEIAENALLAAVLSYAELGQFKLAGNVYVELAHLPLEPSRRNHYARAAQRYQNAQDTSIDLGQLPNAVRGDSEFPDVWHVDVIEWEQRGVVSEVCADVMLDRATWSEVIRRRAMVARMTALPCEMAPHAPIGAWLQVTENLAQTELYATIAPLEKLYRRPEPEIRAAVIQALGRFLFKRSFITLRRALLDPELTVRTQAWNAIRQLRFPHAFDPLARIYRESTDLSAQQAALAALAMVDTEEAAEFMLSVLQQVGSSERSLIDSWIRSCGPRLIQAARDALPSASGDYADLLRFLLNSQTSRLR